MKCSRTLGPRHRQHGFTLIEMAMVMAIIIIMSTVAIMTMGPTMSDTRMNGAYDQVLMALRNARQASVTDRHVYLVTFNGGTPNNTFTVQRMIGGNTGTADPNGLTTYTLSQTITFNNMSGIPTLNAKTPDNIGVGALPIHFDYAISGGNNSAIYFQPDGSARDINGNINNGVVYLADGVNLYNTRAISMMGAAGRIRGWRLVPNPQTGLSQWLQQ